MTLDLNALTVQSFETEPTHEEIAPSEPQPEPIDPETRFYPCTQAHQLTCVGCA